MYARARLGRVGFAPPVAGVPTLSLRARARGLRLSFEVGRPTGEIPGRGRGWGEIARPASRNGGNLMGNGQAAWRWWTECHLGDLGPVIIVLNARQS